MLSLVAFRSSGATTSVAGSSSDELKAFDMALMPEISKSTPSTTPVAISPFCPLVLLKSESSFRYFSPLAAFRLVCKRFVCSLAVQPTINKHSAIDRQYFINNPFARL